MATVDLQYRDHLAWEAKESKEGKVTPLDHLGALALLAVIFSGFIATLGDFNRAVVATGGMLILAILAAVRSSGRTSHWALAAFAICMLSYGLSSFYDQTFRLDINYYVAPIVGLGAFHIRPKVLTAYVLCALVLQVALQLYEWLTGNFVYYALGKYDNELYTEEVFEGAAGIFRSKGMFEASTVMGASFVYFSVITRLNLYVILLGIFCCVLGYARLGLTLEMILLMIFLFSSFNPKRVALAIIGFLLAAVVGYFIFSRVAGSEFNFEFMYSTFDTGSSQNDSRIDFWIAGINFLSSMNASELIFGGASRYFLEIGNSSENAWINILAIAGGPMLLVYLLGCFWFARGDRFSLAAQTVIFLSSMIASNFQSLATCVLFWVAALAAVRPIRAAGHHGRDGADTIVMETPERRRQGTALD